MNDKLTWFQKFNRLSWSRFSSARRDADMTSPAEIRGLHRLVKIVDEDTIELKNSISQKRWMYLVFAIFSIGYVSVYQPATSKVPILPKPVLGLFAPEYYGEWKTRQTEQLLERFGNRELNLPRAENVQLSARRAREEWKTGLVISIFLFGPALWWIFRPRPPGIRVDRKRKLVYTWRYFRLYCVKIDNSSLHQLDPHYVSPRGGFANLVRLPYDSSVHLIYVLRRARNQKKLKPFVMGCNPAAVPHQATIMHDAASSFLFNKHLFDENDPEWLDLLKTTPRGRNNLTDWLSAIGSFHPIPAIWPRSTKRRLDEFLESQKNARSRR